MTGSRPFAVGRGYTRREIHEVVGGSLEQYMPSVSGRIVAVCLNPDPHNQPDPPAQILVGPGPTVRKRAETLWRQGGPVPVFIRRAANDWEFRGFWCPTRLESDPVQVAKEKTLAGVRRPVVAVLWLQQCDP